MISNSDRNESAPLWPPLLVLALAFLAATAWNLHLQSIARPDEPRYAAPARTMLRGEGEGGWLVPEFNARPRLLKPILFYWLIAGTGAAGQAAGLDLATAMRLGPLLMGLLAVLGTYLLGRKLYGARCGFLAAAMLITTRFFHETSRELVVDMTLTACLLWAWLFCWLALERLFVVRQFIAADGAMNRATTNCASPILPLLGFYLCLGLACMTKGPMLVALFVVVPLVVYLAWSRRLADLKCAGLWWGVPLALGVGCWWFVAVQQHGHDISFFFLTENLARAGGQKDHQKFAPFLFYIQNLGENFVPWGILIPFAAWWSWREYSVTRGSQSNEPSDDNEARPGFARAANSRLPVAHSSFLSAEPSRFLACALGVPFLLLGVILSKRALYFLPLYPFLALWLAHAWDAAFLAREGQPAKGARAALIVLALAILGACGALVGLREKWHALDKDLLLLIIMSAAMAGGLWMAARNLRDGCRYQASLQTLAVTVALWIGFEAVARPAEERFLNRAAFYRKVCELLNGRPVVMLGYSSNEAVWYLDRPGEPIDDVRWPDLNARFFEAKNTVLLVPRKLLEREPELKKAVIFGETKDLRRGDEEFVLAVPNPQSPPDESLFRSRGKGGDDDGATD